MRILSFLLALLALPAAAQDFDQYFCDSTLRIDYQFVGNANEQHIAVSALSKSPRWWGKRQRLAEVPVRGNGQIAVRSRADHRLIYLNSFSTLFQEWLTYDEARTQTQAFENVFLVPMPKEDVDITVTLFDNRLQPTATLTYPVSPRDILIKKTGCESRTPYTTTLAAADTARCVHIAFVAEGYTEAEMPVFLQDVQTAQDALFAHEPFRSMRSRFNIIAVESPSQDSGTSQPGQGIWKHTALSSHFDTFYSARYLTTLHLADLHNVLAGLPYEHIIVLVNTDRYGGGGILNSYNLTSTHHSKYRPVVVHEFGHSFAGLADEYAYDQEPLDMYPHDVEPWEPNITTLVDFASKWQDLVPKGTPVPTPATAKSGQVGVYEGAGYSPKGVYRPVQDCRMRTNEHPEFCPVCQRAIAHVIKFYTE